MARRKSNRSQPISQFSSNRGTLNKKPTRVKSSRASIPRTEAGFGKFWRFVIGRPLRYSESAKEEINPVEGLSALSLDALTSVAYGPEALIAVLALGGANALHLILPITAVIVGLLAILVVSYRQVIEAYPGGGGAYAVAKDNLGVNASLLAASSLIVDYTLTVAVSVAAGVGALTSAFPTLSTERIPMCLAIIAIITVMNLRGLGETARVFLLPTFIFIVGIFLVIGLGLFHPFNLVNVHSSSNRALSNSVQTVGILLILKAFSAGCSALTGVEAIANGVPLYQEPRAQRAKQTELLLGVLLGSMLLGLAFLADRWHLTIQSNQTILSQIMNIALGQNIAYYFLSIIVTIMLALAANTSFGGLPVLASLLARDNFLPHRFALRGDRQVYTFGIWILAILSSLLIIGVNGQTDTLIPLFAIGVFTGFTLSQSGLVLHWRATKPKHWNIRASINGFGAVITGISALIFLFTKFTSGAWIVVIAVPFLIYLFKRICRYYNRVGTILRLEETPAKPVQRQSMVIIPISQVSRLTQYAVSEAMSIGTKVVAIYVKNQSSDPGKKAEEIQNEHEEIETSWREWDPGIDLEILENDYSSIVKPIVAYIDKIRKSSDSQIVILIPVVIPDRKRYRLLHNQLDVLLTAALSGRSDLIIARAKLPLGEMLTKTKM